MALWAAQALQLPLLMGCCRMGLFKIKEKKIILNMHVEFSGCKTCLNHSPEDENPLLFTGVLQFFCAALQSCGSPNLKEKHWRSWSCSVYVCLIIICIRSESVSKAAHKYHSWYLCLFNLCSYSLYRKQDHWTYSSVIKEHSVIAILRTILASFKANLAIWQEAVVEGNPDFVSSKV